MGDVLTGLDMNKNVYRAHREVEPLRNIEIKDIRATGMASPEGPQEEGPSTLQIGAVDEKNIELAFIRAIKGAELTKEQFEKLGIKQDKLEKVAENITPEEMQFSDDEMKKLANLAHDQSGVDDLEKIFNLTVDYNDNNITNPDVLNKLDEIIGSKRKVEIAIDYQGGQKRILLIPLPWILLLPLLLPTLRRKKKKPSSISPGEPGIAEEPPASTLPEGIGDNLYLEREKELRPSRSEELSESSIKSPEPEEPFSALKKVELPAEDTVIYEKMEEMVWADDLYIFFDDQSAIERGLDYHKIANSLFNRYDDFKNKMERELFITDAILEAWQKHDLQCRKEAMVSEDQIMNGLDYKNQPEQIIWARMHAKALVQLVEEKKKEQKDYLDLMAPRVRKMFQRRILRRG